MHEVFDRWGELTDDEVAGFVGAHVQRIWSAGAVSQGVGEEFLQGGEVGQESVQVWGLQHQNLMTSCLAQLHRLFCAVKCWGPDSLSL